MTPFEFAGRFALVAIAMAVMDWCWTKYMMHAAAKRAAPAAWWSAAIIAVSAFSVTQYVQEPWLIPAALLGAWLGTFYAVQHDSGSYKPNDKA